LLINGFDVRVGVRVTPLTTENTPRYKEDAPARKNLSDYFYLSIYLSIYLFIYLSIYLFIYLFIYLYKRKKQLMAALCINKLFYECKQPPLTITF